MRRALHALILVLMTSWVCGAAESKLRFSEPASVESETKPRRRHVVVDIATAQELTNKGAVIVGPASGDLLVVSASGSTGLPGIDPASKISVATKAATALHHLVVLFHPDVDPRNADRILQEAGVVRLERPEVLPNQYLIEATASQMVALSAFDEIAYIYPASKDLVAGVPLNSCPGPVTEYGNIAQYVATVGNGWTGDANLTYSLTQLTNKLSRETVRSAVEQALGEWSRHSRIRFSYAQQPGAARNLNILFASGGHGDPYSFDGRGRVLAHTFYPAGVNREPLAGDIHMDDDEPWQNAAEPDLYSVILHEVGHALGLGHADRPNSVMYPYYRKLSTLQPDDIAALTRLYPAAPTAAPEPAPSQAPAGNDKTAPTLTITSPSTSVYSTSASSVKITGTARDAGGVKLVTWTSSTGHSGTAIGTTTWSVDSIPLLIGDNTITIRAYDEANNSSRRNVIVSRR